MRGKKIEEEKNEKKKKEEGQFFLNLQHSNLCINRQPTLSC